MNSGDIIVSSIRAGMKREFAMMMRAQLEMGALSAGPRRMTRSQASSSFFRDMRIHGRSIKKVYSKRVKKNKKLLQKVKDVKDMNMVDVASDDEGADGSIIQSVSIAPERNEHTKIGANLIQPLCAESVPSESSAPEDPGTILLQNSCAESVPPETIVPEVFGTSLAKPSCDELTSLVEVDTGVMDYFETLQDNVESVEKLEMETIEPDLEDGVTKPFLVETLSPHSSVSGGLNIGFERNGESTSGISDTPPRRFTRSCLKHQDDDMESESSAMVIGTLSTLTTNSCPSKLEMKMSTKIKLKRTPKRLKDLLNTGLLEGLHVRYVHGMKVNKQARFELGGVIQGNGILCSCDECNGIRVVTPNKFELHAHSGNKRPPEYIYLENGKSLRDVLNACKQNMSDSLDQVILNVIGRVNYTTAFCLDCKGIIPEGGAGRHMLLCNSCVLVKEANGVQTYVCDDANRSRITTSVVSVSPTSERDNLESVLNSSNHGHLKCKGKLTRKDLKMHRFVFSEDILPDGTVLSYFMHGKKRLEGVKKDGGIFCMCCNEVVSPSQFEAHAGFPSRRKPYMGIFTSNGVSLHQLSLKLSKDRRSFGVENDDLCSICEDGGDLLCCENCPRAFHSECVGLSSIPQGSWYCKYCQNMLEKEKFAENDANAIAAGRVPGADPLAEISQRCIRIVGTFVADIGGCAICRQHDFSSPEFTDRTVIICDQCEKEYHVGCLREHAMDDLKALPDGEWFCSKQCSNINSAIQNLVSDGDQKLPDKLLSNINKKCQDYVLEQDPCPEIDIRWRLLTGINSSEDTRVWLSGAVSIFHDRFDPIADTSAGNLDLIPHMVYGRHFKDQDFCGMHCAVLTVNSVVVSAGLFRIFGEELGELPLVATRSDSQGKGYFQALFYCIENFLKSQNVKEIVLPAAHDAESMWKNRFGFQNIGQEQLDNYKRSYQMMMFEGTDVLHKNISQ